MNGASSGTTSRILTVPNLLSFARILAIPAFVWLIVREGTEQAGLLLFGLVVSTDWLDGYIARRTGRVTELGKLLDPVADRLVIAGGLVAMVVRDAFPLWAALLILVRDAAILGAGAVLLVTRGVRIEVRWAGKVATFGLMAGVPLVAWGNLGLFLEHAALALGWGLTVAALIGYYVATWLYVGDLRRASAAPRGG